MDLMRQRLNRWDKREQLVFRQFVSQVERVTLDGNGRLLIAKRFAQMAHITQDVKFIGMGDTIEIWSNSLTEQPFMNAEDFGAALEDMMGDKGKEA
jgi:MraZ protein